MKSIRRKILVPFMLIIIITPIVTLFAFNLYIRNYINSGIVTQLKNTVTTTQVLIKTELVETIYETDQEKIDQSLLNLYRILRTSKIALNTELLLYKETGEMIYPVEYKDTFLNEDVIGEVRKSLTKIGMDNVYKISVGDEKFIVMGYRLTQLPISNIPYVVFISSMDIANPIFTNINLVLLTVMLLGIGIGILIAYRIANRVVNPVQELRDATVKISEHKEFDLKHQTNIKEIAQLSDSIMKMSSRIEAYDRAQKAFLQNASHELKTPLMSIQGYAEGIENNLFPVPQKAGKIIKEESRKLSQLLTELLILSRIENQNYDLDFEKTLLNEVMKEYFQQMEGIAIKENKILSFAETEEPVFVSYNESLFTQALMNIASNAIRYASKNISVSLYKTGENAVIEVNDDGKGIKEEDIPHLYERFYKGENGQFGLGLAIAKSAIEAMHGTISAKNLQKGASFILTLPLWKE